MNNSKYIEIKEIYAKYQKKINNENNYNIEKNKENILKELIKDVLSKLSCSEISIMTSYHNYLSIGTGVNCGLSTKSNNLCVIQKISKFYLKYFNKNNEAIKNKLINNNIKNNFFELLNKNENKSDKNILLINLLLRNILYNNKNISRLILKESNIIPGDILKDEEISYILNINKEKTINNKNQKNYESINKKTNIYSNNSIIVNNNNFIIENKENNCLNEQYFETDIFKNTKVSNTLISIDGLINNSRNTITQKSKKKLKNIDNNGDVNDSIKKEKKDEFIINNKSIEVIFPKNKYSPLDNEYFNNIENNFNLFFYDNHSNKMLNECYYNEELVNILIKLLDINTNIRIITYKIIIDNILSLITAKKYNSYDNNNIINQCFISQNDKNKIFLIYEKYKKEIINNYNNKKSFHNNAYKLFIKQYDKYILLNNIDYNNIIKEGYILFLNNTDITQNKNNIFFEIEKIENKNEKIIILFILIHDFYYKINLYDNISINESEKEQIKNILYINNFPLLKRKGLELNKQYYLIDLDSNIKYYDSKCKIIKDKNNENGNQEFFCCYLLLYDNFLYIGDSSNNTSYTIIKYKFLINSCSIMVDNYNNKNIVLYISNDINKKNNLEIYLDFKDYNTSKTFKNLIDQEIKNSILYEKGKIKQFIEQLK